MANLDKNILITPNVGSNNDPTIVFSAANTTSNAANITLRAYPTSNGTLSFEGSAGQLFSITNNLTGSLFSVNDISGIPSIEVLDTGRVNLAQYNGSVVIGANTSATTSNSNTTGELVVFGGVGVTGNIYVGGTSAGSNGIYTDILRYAANGLPWVMGSGGGGGGTSIDQAARDTANSASANTIIIQGVDVTQNTRLTVSEGVDLSQNVRLDFSNAAITIVQGVDVGQNSRMTIIEGTDASQNVRLDFSNAAITIIQGTDTSQNARMVIIEGTDVSQNVRLDYSNTALTIAQGVDNSQNVRLDFSNTRMTIIEGTDASQNVRLDYSNAAITIIQGTDVTQNTRLTVIEGTDASQNVRLDYSNTAITIIQGVDNSQNVRIDFSNTAINATDGKMQTAYNTANNAVANLGPVITTNSVARVIIANTTISTSATSGALTVNGGVGVTGNLYLQPASTFVDTILRVGATAKSANLVVEGYGSNFKMSSCTATVLSIDGTTADANIVGFQSTTLNVGSQFSTSNVQIYTDATSTAPASLKIYGKGTGAAYANIGSTPSVASQVNIISSLPSTSNSTGALVVTGGVGVSGNIYVGGTNAGANGIYTDNLRYAANGLPWVMNSGSGGGTGTGNANTFGWLANTIIVANSAGYLSNSNSFFVASNNAIVTPNVVITQSATASFPLNFGQSLGNKIGLYDFGSGTGYGFGVQSQKLQIFHGNSTDHTSFGHGSSSSFAEQFRVAGVASAVNYLQVVGATTTNSPILSAQGSSANVAINLVPKGNAAVMITGNTTGTIAAANSIYVGDRVGYANANNISVVYQSYNASTNSLDVVFG